MQKLKKSWKNYLSRSLTAVHCGERRESGCGYCYVFLSRYWSVLSGEQWSWSILPGCMTVYCVRLNMTCPLTWPGPALSLCVTAQCSEAVTGLWLREYKICVPVLSNPQPNNTHLPSPMRYEASLCWLNTDLYYLKLRKTRPLLNHSDAGRGHQALKPVVFLMASEWYCK